MRPLTLMMAGLLASLAIHAHADPPKTEKKPLSYEGITASLKLEKNQMKVKGSFKITVTLTCTTQPHRLFNPYAKAFLEEPYHLAVCNSRGEEVSCGLELSGGSMVGPSDRYYVSVAAKEHVSSTRTVQPFLLKPGDYTLQVSFTELLLNYKLKHSKTIITSEQVPFSVTE